MGRGGDALPPPRAVGNVLLIRALEHKLGHFLPGILFPPQRLFSNCALAWLRLRCGFSPSAWISAMGWLFGCFGCGGGRKERLPRLCSRTSRGHKSTQQHAQSSQLTPSFATAAGGNPWLRSGECLSVDSNGLQHLRIRDRPLQSVLEADQAKFLKEEFRSCVISLETPHEPLKVSKAPLEAPRWDSSPEDSPVSTSASLPPPSNNVEAGTVPEGMKDKNTQAALAAGTAEPNPKPVPEQVSLVCLPKTAGFFMLPKKRSFAHRSFMWQEPLSPVAEAESSISSEEEGNVPSQANVSINSDCSRRSQAEAPSSSEVLEGLRSEGSDVEITPVRCMSPVVERKTVEARSDGSKDKENIFACKTPMEAEKRQDHQTSVLTPVGNVLQWRQLKEEAWHKNKRVEEKEDDFHEDKVSPTTSSGSNELEIESENYSFFSELQWGSTQITPQLRPTSRWDDETSSAEAEAEADATPKLWDGQGIPNTTRKYKEDQRVTWHSTPFEVRIDKALSSSRQLRATDAAGASRSTLF
ncbi:uncharacterized protein LOC112343701 [Selaginella moellendorffii]|uniref:uncharacterized protein LOC112343701 n=1 Tax=Selaginella moellendorffii TaxID=88036 RepID=UPI000D1CBD45|nr:uncharacterized protein LOC112343701 [Selaginella moellendorffii]|eukprot:XP_024523431.1 uncharacterized protein LOC112343701 [Selaginella moellendorffii]